MLDPRKEYLETTIRKIKKNEILLPDFQRQFVWKEEEIQKKLVASVLTRLPIGSILLLRSNSSHEYSCKPLGAKEPISQELERYLSDMADLFSDFSECCREADRHNKMAHLVCVMQSWYRSLPQTSMVFSNPDNEEQNMSQIVAFRKIFASLYLNPRQILFEKLPTIFSSNTLEETYEAVANARKEIDAHIHVVKRSAVQTIRTTFDLEATADLGQSLKAWYHRLPEATKNSVISTASETITDAILGINTSDEERIAGDIVYAVTGTFIEDWRTETNDLLRTGLNAYIQELKNQENIVTKRAQKLVFLSESGKPSECFYDYDPEHISSIGTFFRNDLISTLEEYDTLEKSEKIGILIEIIRKLTT